MDPRRWTVSDIPSQEGRIAVITGANSGVGFETAKMLAASGATVVLACRSEDRAAAACTLIRAAVPGAEVRTLRLDLASLATVRESAQELRARYPRLDLLVNNAGVLWPPYEQTPDGFEPTFGTNHLGHFAFTGLVLDTLLTTSGSRIVTVSSQAHRFTRIRLDDLQSERGSRRRTAYRQQSAYGRSKLANLMFTYELQRRLARAGAHTIAVAAHPGGSQTGIFRHFDGVVRLQSRWLVRMLTQSAAMGALPTLRAAVDPEAAGGDYYGPDGPLEITGHPRRVLSNRREPRPVRPSRLSCPRLPDAHLFPNYELPLAVPRVRAGGASLGGGQRPISVPKRFWALVTASCSGSPFIRGVTMCAAWIKHIAVWIRKPWDSFVARLASVPDLSM